MFTDRQTSAPGSWRPVSAACLAPYAYILYKHIN